MRLALVIISLLLVALGLTSSTRSSRADEACDAPDAWFPVTPPPTNSKPDPDKDCDFYQWAWQTFLYVVQPQPGAGTGPRFLAFKTPEELFSAAATPRFPRRGAAPLVLAPRLAKQPDPVSVQDFLQATSNGVLVDQNGRVVYYGIHLNDDFVRFIADHQFGNVDNIAAASDELEYPRGCLELKSSWKILGTSDDPSKFFHAEAQVAVLTLDENGKPKIDPKQTRKETVGLVGLHVVGVVDGHPEFIWATFEHIDNAPTRSAGADPQQPVDSIRDWTFYRKGTLAKDCNQKKQLTFKSQPDQTFQPSIPICRVFPNEIDPEVDSLDKSVHSKITAMAPSLAVWNNYMLTGAVWMNNPAYFRAGFDFAHDDEAHSDKRILGGERQISNSTMETFTQEIRVNCFTCHRTVAEAVGSVQLGAKRINVSHILTNAYLHAKQSH